MNFESYKKQFIEKAEKHSYSEDIIQKCLSYSYSLNQKNLPIIYNSYHLSALIGYSHSYLTRASISTCFFYRKFNIPKKNGNHREILEPLPSLKQIQYFILENILYTQKSSRFCKSYIPKIKFKSYLKYHSNKKELLSLDIEDFFPSIKYKLVYDLFREKLGYTKDVSEYLTLLCTYHPFSKKGNYNKLNRYLPQGAPTSPYLTNLILKEFDNTIANFCSDNNINYTRYADDMIFSGTNIEKEKLISAIENELNKLGLKLNKNKTNFYKQNKQQIISGVVINNKIQLPKNDRNDIRKVMFFIKKYGLEDHMKAINETRAYYLNHLLGRIQYGLDLNPNDNELKQYKEYLHSLKIKSTRVKL